jgi:hypothetical protein
LGRALAIGALVCALYSVLQVVVNGVVLDEVVVPAQIIAGAVHYPAGHPHQVYYPQFFNLANSLSAAVWSWAPDALIHSGVRNVLFLFASLFSTFAMTLVLARRAIWAHLAAALVAADAPLRLSGVYPIFVFPNFYSHGHIGLCTLLWAVALLLARNWRWAGFLIGILPSLHAPMAMMAWAWATLYLAFAAGRPTGKDRSTFFWWAAAGIVVSAAVAGVVYWQSSRTVLEAPYDVTARAQDYYRSFTESADRHRRFLPFRPFGYLVNPVFFFLCGGLMCRWLRQEKPNDFTNPSHRDWFWVLVLGGGVATYVYGTTLLRFVVGLPRFVEMTMPLRFSNVLAMCAVPLTVAGWAVLTSLLPLPRRRAALALIVALVCAAGVARMLEGPQGPLYRGRVADNLFFAMSGVLLGLALYVARGERRLRGATLLAVGCVSGALLAASSRTRGGVTFAAVLLATLVLLILAERLVVKTLQGHRQRSFAPAALLAASLLLALAALRGRDVDPFLRTGARWDVMNGYDRQLQRWLAAHTRPDELILTPVLPRAEIQAKTGHPVLMEMETLWLMSYKPALAATIGTMAKDLYGVDYLDRGPGTHFVSQSRFSTEDPVWLEAWKKRTLQEWQALQRKYNFRLVLSPADTRLHLPEAVAVEGWTLYLIP